MDPVIRWWFTPVDVGRVHALRAVAYLFVIVEAVWTTGWIHDHGAVPGGLYRPLLLGRLVAIPIPTASWVTGVGAITLLSAVLALTATARRSSLVVPLGWLVVLAYLWWMVIGMSYGKVDHDRFAFLVLLFVLPSVPAVAHGDRRESAAAGWAIRMVQVAIVATYALSAWAKVRFGGWGWADGATLTRAILRRGTALADVALGHPGFMRGAQWATLLFEVATVMILVARPRQMPLIVAGLAAFHLATFLTLGIIFLPHLVALLALLPLEHLSWGLKAGPARSHRVAASTVTRGRRT